MWAKFLKAYFYQDDGASAAEFAMVITLFVVLLFGAIDFGRAMFEWNSAAKATQIGARFAVVNEMADSWLQSYDAIAEGHTPGNNETVPESVFPDPVVCTSSSCTGHADATLDANAFNAIVAAMQTTYGRIQPENVVVEYEHVELGFSGNPFGSDISPNVTVKLQNLDFELVTPILSSTMKIAMPDFASSVNGEMFGVR